MANKDFPSEHWIYWVGPLLGALLAAGFFWFIKSCEYQTANPGQDFDDLEEAAFNPEQDLTRPVVSPTAALPERANSPLMERIGTNERTSKDERSATYEPARLGSATTYSTLGHIADGNLTGSVPDRSTTASAHDRNTTSTVYDRDTTGPAHDINLTGSTIHDRTTVSP